MQADYTASRVWSKMKISCSNENCSNTHHFTDGATWVSVILRTTTDEAEYSGTSHSKRSHTSDLWWKGADPRVPWDNCTPPQYWALSLGKLPNSWFDPYQNSGPAMSPINISEVCEIPCIPSPLLMEARRGTWFRWKLLQFCSPRSTYSVSAGTKIKVHNEQPISWENFSSLENCTRNFYWSLLTTLCFGPLTPKNNSNIQPVLARCPSPRLGDPYKVNQKVSI